METLEGGGKLWRSAKAEERARAKFDQERMLAMERFYEKQNASMSKEEEEEDEDEEGARLFRAVEVCVLCFCLCVRLRVSVCL